MNAYQQSIAALIEQLNSDIKRGLSDWQVRTRLEKFGQNALPEQKARSWFFIFLSQFQNPLIYVLIIAAAIIFFVGDDGLDAFIISGVLLFNAVIGTIQEGRTHNIIASLRRFIHTNSVVVRDGKREVVEDSQLVPGDIIILQGGQCVPADARLIEVNNVHLDEALLTGESSAVEKSISVIEDEVPVGDQANMVFKGTYILSGTGIALVIATGVKTEIGKIHTAVQEIDTEIPLKKEVDRLSYIILLFILGMCVFLFGLGFAMGKPIQELLIMLTALFICVVPEGLPVVLTLVLVSGAFRMAKKHVLAKNLQAVEALGRTDVIVIDKTGTLTRNEMLVSHVFADDVDWHVTGHGYYTDGQVRPAGQTQVTLRDQKSAIHQMGIAACLLNNTEITFLPKLKLFDIKGDPTEAAMYVFCQKMGFSRLKLEQQYSKVYEIPFESDLKYHAGFYTHDGQGKAFVVGAPEVIFDRVINGNALREKLTSFLNDGLRVVAVATKAFSPGGCKNNTNILACYKGEIADGLTLLGLFGIQDSIRPEVKDIVARARDAGLEVVMATGDHKQTALHVAKQVALYREGDEAIDGPEFAALSDDELLERLPNITVYSRVSPTDKMRIIDLYHQKNKIVAMTGDGINDAPSLVAADLGIAMGSIGTEVAKEASDLVLLNDSFANIINAIAEGRHIFYTLRRVVLYFFATNMGEILIVFFALMTNMPLPITAAQILWLNLVTDGFLDIALSTEPQEKGLLDKQWLKQKVRLVDWALIGKMLFMAVPMGLVSLSMFAQYYKTDLVKARTITLITMAMFQWFNAWSCRSEHKSLWEIGLFTNKWLIVATGFVLFLQFFILHVPFMQYIFKTVPLSVNEWGVIFAVSFPILILEELRKWCANRLFR